MRAPSSRPSARALQRKSRSCGELASPWLQVRPSWAFPLQRFSPKPREWAMLQRSMAPDNREPGAGTAAARAQRPKPAGNAKPVGPRQIPLQIEAQRYVGELSVQLHGLLLSVVRERLPQ